MMAVHVVFLALLISAANKGLLPGWVSLIRRIPLGDKVAHFVLFGILALLANVCCRCRRIRLGVLHVLTGSAVILVLSFCEETSQLFLQRRTFDPGDLLANALGIAIIGRCGLLTQRTLTHI